MPGLLLITDIFGISAMTGQFVAAFDKLAAGSKVLDPYQGQQLTFADEAQAYQTFMQQCGHDRYSELVLQALTECDSDTLVLAFSAGASAAWRALAQHDSRSLIQFVGFYPSQIRHHLTLAPHCSTTLIFPRREAHFDVNQVMEKVSSATVTCLHSGLLHGFCNPDSENYCPAGSQHVLQCLSDKRCVSSPSHMRQQLSAGLVSSTK